MKARACILFVMMAGLIFASVADAKAGIFEHKRIKGSGQLSTETHDLDNLRGVINTTWGELEIRIGAEQGLEAEMEDNLHEHLVLDVDDGILKIRFAKGLHIKPRKSMRMKLTLGELEYVALTGSGDLSAENLQCRDLALKLTGSGDISINRLEAREVDARLTGSGNLTLAALDARSVDLLLSGSGDVDAPDLKADELAVSLSGSGDSSLSGRTKEQELRISGSGDYHGGKLASDLASVRVTGSGYARLDVSEQLEVFISGSGDVRVSGRPEISKRITGSGDLRQI